MKNLFALLVLAVIVSGCMSSETTTTTDEPTPTTVKTTGQTQSNDAPTTTAAKPGTPTTTVKESGGILADMAAAVSSGLGYKCTYTYEDITSEGWVKGEKYYFTSATAQGKGYVISDGTWMYTWADNSPEGVKFNIDQMKEFSKNKPQGQGGYSDPQKTWEAATHIQCVPAAITDATFSPPSGITFKDMGEMLKQLQGMGGGQGLPAGYPTD
jgi:hypothetical protein